MPAGPCITDALRFQTPGPPFGNKSLLRDCVAVVARAPRSLLPTRIAPSNSAASTPASWKDADDRSARRKLRTSRCTAGSLRPCRLALA